MEEQVHFSHKSVLLDECMEALAIRPDGIYMDGTAGGAGSLQSTLGKGGGSGFQNIAIAVASRTALLPDGIEGGGFVLAERGAGGIVGGGR